MYQVQYRLVEEAEWHPISDTDSLDEAFEIVKGEMWDNFLDGTSGDCVYRIVKEG